MFSRFYKYNFIGATYLVATIITFLAAPAYSQTANSLPSLRRIKAPDKTSIYCAVVDNKVTSGTIQKKSFITTQESIAALTNKMKNQTGAKFAKIKKQLDTFKANKKMYMDACKKSFKRSPYIAPVIPTPEPTSTPTATPTPDALKAKQDPFSRADVQLLYERAGFGDPPKEAYIIAEGKKENGGGSEALLDYFMTYTKDQALEDELPVYINLYEPYAINAWAHYIFLKTPNQYHEKLALHTLHNLIPASVEALGGGRRAMADYLALLRKHSQSGQYRELVQEMATNPVMLYWLDGVSNTKEVPNENFARELMELFTIGTVDLDGNENYTQKTIAQIARACTGWKVKPVVINGVTEFRSEFDLSRHDAQRDKLIFEGTLDGMVDTCQDVINFIFDHHPNTANHIATRLLKEYLTPTPSRELIEAFARELKESDFNIHVPLRKLFLSEVFYDHEYRNLLIKSPIERSVQLDRSLKLTNMTAYFTSPASSTNFVINSGMVIGSPPTVFGWKQEDWNNGFRIFEMYNSILRFMLNAAEPTGHAYRQIVYPDYYLTILDNKAGDELETLDYIIDRMGLQISEEMHEKLLYFMRNTWDANDNVVPFVWRTAGAQAKSVKIQGLAQILGRTTDYQFK